MSENDCWESKKWRRDLVWWEDLEVCRWIGDDIAFGARILLDAGGRVTEPIQTNRQDTVRLQQVREQVAVLHTVLQTTTITGLSFRWIP